MCQAQPRTYIADGRNGRQIHNAYPVESCKRIA